MHEHSYRCLGTNELDELCCRDLALDRLRNADRWVVRLSDGSTMNVFTDSRSDAFAIARADGRDPVSAEPDPQPWPGDDD